MKQETTLSQDKLCAEIRMCQEGCPAELSVASIADGSVAFTLIQDGVHRSYPTTLGQAIQLRDFLNRHIDELALQQTRSLAQRASDDPTQLAAVEEVQGRPGYLAQDVIDRVAAEGDERLLSRVEEIPHSAHGKQTGVVRVEVSRGCGRRFQYTPSYRLSCGEQSPFGLHAALCPDCSNCE